MYVAVKCSFFLIFYCKLKLKVKLSSKHTVLEDSQLCANVLAFRVTLQ